MAPRLQAQAVQSEPWRRPTAAYPPRPALRAGFRSAAPPKSLSSSLAFDALRQCKQRTVAAARADERQADRRAVHSAGRNLHLRQATEPRDRGQAEGAIAELRQLFLACVEARRDGAGGRDQKDTVRAQH